MRTVLIILVSTIVSIFSARAQDYIVTATGTTNPINSGTFSAVPSGTPFTFTLTFNAATTEVTTGTYYTGPGVENYIDSSATATASFGAFSFSGLALTFQVFSGYAGGIYGYEFGASATGGVNFSIHLWSPDASVAPDTSLSSIQTSPVSDFGQSSPSQNTRVFELNTPGGDIGGIVNDFSVSTSVPEPSSLPLSAIAVFTLGWLQRRSSAAHHRNSFEPARGRWLHKQKWRSLARIAILLR